MSYVCHGNLYSICLYLRLFQGPFSNYINRICYLFIVQDSVISDGSLHIWLHMYKSFFFKMLLMYIYKTVTLKDSVGTFGSYSQKASLPTALTLSLLPLCVKRWRKGLWITWQLPLDVLVSLQLVCGNQRLGLKKPKQNTSKTKTHVCVFLKHSTVIQTC